MPKLEIEPDLTLHYQWSGEEGLPVLIMVHGLTGNLAVWHLHIAPALQDHYRILTYDLRGHGYSSMPATGYSSDHHAGDLLKLMDALDIERAHLVGHSLGADVAMYLGANHPERVHHIMCIEPALPALVAERATEDWEGWDYWAEALLGGGLEVPPDKRTDFEYLMRRSLELTKQWGPLRGLPRNPKKTLRLLDETEVLWEMYEIGTLPLDKLSEIKPKIILMYSQDTGFLTTREILVEHLTNYEEILLPRTDMGHFGPLEQPELVAKYILDMQRA